MLMVLMGTNKVWASGFHLKSIGNVQTNGIQGGKWWYTGVKPTLKGESGPGEAVNVTIDGTTNQVNADSAGEWLFIPNDPLTEGDHQISLENNGAKIDFTLAIGTGNVDWDQVGKGGGETLPAAGVFWPTLLLLGAGLSTAVVGGKISGASKN